MKGRRQDWDVGGPSYAVATVRPPEGDIIAIPIERTRAERRREARRLGRPGKPVPKMRDAAAVGQYLVERGHAVHTSQRAGMTHVTWKGQARIVACVKGGLPP